jgi:hypothetical protein
MKSGPRRTKNWGVTSCLTERTHAVYIALGDKPDKLRRVRDMVYGRNAAVVRRALLWGAEWCTPEPRLAAQMVSSPAYNLPDSKHLLTTLLLARVRDSRHGGRDPSFSEFPGSARGRRG